MSLWAVTFLEYWKRTNSILAHRWDCSEFEDIEVMVIDVQVYEALNCSHGRSKKQYRVVILQSVAVSKHCFLRDFLTLGEAKARIYSIGTKDRS